MSDPSHPGAERLRRSAKFWGWDHSFIIKQDQPELNPPYKIWHPNYRAEQLGQLDFIRAHPEVEQVVYMDAWDTVFTGPPQELPATPGQLWFMGDTVLHPDNPSLAARFPKVGLEEFRFLNAGVMWGDPRVMAELAADFLQHSPESLVNQEYFTYRYIYEQGVGRKRLFLDTKAEVSLNVMLLQKRFFQMKGVRPHFTVSESNPLFLHVPGHGSALRETGKPVPIPEELEKLYAA